MEYIQNIYGDLDIHGIFSWDDEIAITLWL